jgi:hypothetical protein
MRICSSTGNDLPDALIFELFGRDFVSACAVEPADVELSWGVEPEEMCASDMNQIQRTERRYLRLPVILMRIDDAPVFRLLHLKVGEFLAVMCLNVLVGVAPERPVEAPDGLALGNPDSPGDCRKRNAPEPQLNDLLFALSGPLLGLGRMLVATTTPLGIIVRCLIHGDV